MSLRVVKNDPGSSSVHVDSTEWETQLAKDALSSDERDRLHESTFALPAERKYPIPDISHARNALARVSQHGTAEEQKKVRAAVYHKYPSLKKSAEIAKSGAISPQSSPPDLLEKLSAENNDHVGGTIRDGSEGEQFVVGSMIFDVDAARAMSKNKANAEVEVSEDWSEKINVEEDHALKGKSKNPVMIASLPTEDGIEPLLFDGHHRMYRALSKGKETLPAYVFTPEQTLSIMSAPPDLMAKLRANLKKNKVEKNYTTDIADMQQVISGMDWELTETTSNAQTAKEYALDNLSTDQDFYRKKWLGADAIDKDAAEGLHLDLGSGHCRQPGSIGLDLYPYDHGTLVHDITTGLPFDDGSASHINMSNVPEVDPHTVMPEVERVLMPDGHFIYEGAGEIQNKSLYMKEVSKEQVEIEKDQPQWTKQKFQRLAVPDAATSNDAEPRVSVQQYDMLPADALIAIDAVNYSSSDATSSGRGNRLHGYPSQGALLNKGKKRFSIRSRIEKMDKYQQIVTSVVLSPNEADLQDDFITPEEIEKTAHNYLIEARVVGSMHSKPMDAVVVESYIAPQDFEMTGQYGPQKIVKGAWILSVKINDPKEWAKVLSGEYTGFSVGGFGLRDPM